MSPSSLLSSARLPGSLPISGIRRTAAGLAAALVATLCASGASALDPGDLVVTAPRACAPDPRTESVFRIDPATGDRSILSGLNGDCSAEIGAGSSLNDIEGLTLDENGTILVGDGDGGDGARLLAIDPMDGDRTVVSGCLSPVSSFSCGPGGADRGTGPDLPFYADLAVVDADAAALSILQPGDVVVRTSLPGCGGESALVQIERTSGDRIPLTGQDAACRSLGSGPLLYGVNGTVVAPDGQVYVANVSFGPSGPAQLQILAVDPDTGDRSVVSGCAEIAPLAPTFCVGGFVGAGALLADVDDLTIQTMPFGAFEILARAKYAGCADESVVAIDPTTGDRSVVSGPFGVCAPIGTGPALLDPPFDDDRSIATDGFGTVVTADYRVLEIDVATGERTLVSGCTNYDPIAGVCLGSIVGAGPAIDAHGEVAVVPEPGFGGALLGGAVATCLGARRRVARLERAA
ncbi:MAG: hypothetical protein AAGC67_21245 [Myxococcota bacterium]